MYIIIKNKRSNIKTFTKIENDIYFSSCDTCEAICCDGKHGSIYAQILIDEFEKVSKYFPILFIYGDLNYLKPVILLSDGRNHCPYINNFKCTIYNQRPEVCKTYPLSANIDNFIYVDSSCPAVTNSGINLYVNKKISPNFDSFIFEDYQDKYIKTHFEMEKFNKKENFKYLFSIKGVRFYKFSNSSTNDYINIHLSSLKHLQNYKL